MGVPIWQTKALNVSSPPSSMPMLLDISELKKCIKLQPNNILAYGVWSVTYALAGRYEEAREAWSEVLKIDPKRSVEKVFKVSPFSPDSIERKIAAMHKAGIK